MSSKQLTIVKIGGNVIDNDVDLQEFLVKFNALQGNKILVHGGGKLADRLLKELGIEPKKIDGRRITDGDTLKVVTMVYAGLVNKGIVASLAAMNCNAIGLSGADINAVPASMRPKTPIDYGFVGDVNTQSINANGIKNLIESGFVPIFCSITHDGNGQLLNTNADTMASVLAIAMSKQYKVNLVFCFEKDGVLANVDDDNSIIPIINGTSLQQLVKDGIVEGGMMPKIENALKAVEQGVEKVIIKHAKNLDNDRETTIQR